MIKSDQDFLLLSAWWEDFFVRMHHYPFTLGGISLFGFLVFEFDLKPKTWLIGGFAAMSMIFLWVEIPAFGLIIFSSLALAFLALKNDREGGIYALVGLILFGIVTRLEFVQNLGVGYYIGVILFVLTMTLLVGQRIKKSLKEQREAQMKSVTLENQLLKSTIQPHFITNSLTSLQELIETDPNQANKFIESLAEEFRLFSEMADNKLVPIAQEIALCDAHLEIMSQRKQGTYKLVTQNIEGNEKIPPGVFHTIIENGLTHGFRKKLDGEFLLEKESSNGHVIYRLSNNGDIEESSNGNGTGFKYIKNRLMENFGKEWSLDTSKAKNSYQVSITIPA